MAKRKFDPVHPGVVLAEDFLKGMEISQYRLAKGIAVPPRRINEVYELAFATEPDTPKNGTLLQQFSGLQNSDRKLTGQ